MTMNRKCISDFKDFRSTVQLQVITQTFGALFLLDGSGANISKGSYISSQSIYQNNEIRETHDDSGGPGERNPIHAGLQSTLGCIRAHTRRS